MMRFFGVGLLVFGFVLGGDAAVDASHYHSNPQPRPCERNGISYPVSSYCYTSCAPSAACEVLVCFTGGVAGAQLGAPAASLSMVVPNPSKTIARAK